MEPHTKIKVECPFCQEETLEILTWPAHTELRSSRSAVAKSTTAVRKSEGFELVSEKCSNCGKSATEIKRAWEEGSAIDAEKRRRKLDELKRLGFSEIVRG
jgi:hypothetical protein